MGKEGGKNVIGIRNKEERPKGKVKFEQEN